MPSSQAPFRRSTRVSGAIREILMRLVLEGRIREPAAADAVVSDVRVSDDLGHAHVYLRILGEDTEARRERVLDAMRRAAGFLRREVGKELRVRHVPELQFHWDDTIDNALRIEALLAEERHRDEPEDP